jgi:ABC-2 type transport system permease protein
MSEFIAVTRAVAWRVIHHMTHNPTFLLPGIIFPLFFFTAFAGGLSNVENVPGFDFPSGYTAFQFGFVLLQAATFGGIFTGFTIAGDFERGFSRRLLLAAPNRYGIVAGYVVAAAARALFTAALLFAVAIATGMQVDGGAMDLVGLVTLAAFLNVAATFFAAGVAMRLRTLQAGPAMQMPAFLLLFLAPVYVPLDLLAGWVEGAARINPLTALMDGARDFISGQDADLLLIAGVLAALLAVLGLWALRGLRSAEAAG